MRYRTLGRTGIRVSRLCYGTLTIGPLQANVTAAKGARLIQLALDKGVNFIDTAELYGTYPHIRQAIRHRPEKPVLSSKSYAYTRAGMRDSLLRALDGMDVPAVDVFLLHEQESHLTLAGHRDALEYLLEAKAEGLVRAVGFSCHTVAALRAALTMPEIDVVHPLINLKGVGVRDGTAAEMLSAVKALHSKGVGVFGMKPLGGGHLIRHSKEAFAYVLAQDCLDAIAVGMACDAEVTYNCALFAGETVSNELAAVLRRQERRLQVSDWCGACGTCLEHCPQGALTLVAGRAAADRERCVLCGYCGAYCPEFCLKIY